MQVGDTVLYSWFIKTNVVIQIKESSYVVDEWCI